jgi:hypothetical protein
MGSQPPASTVDNTPPIMRPPRNGSLHARPVITEDRRKYGALTTRLQMSSKPVDTPRRRLARYTNASVTPAMAMPPIHQCIGWIP